MADDETPEIPETPAEETPAEHAVPTEDATEIAGSAEDAALEALQESGEGAEGEQAGETAAPFEPIAGNAVPTEDATEIAGVAEDAPLEAAQELAEAEEAVVEEIVREIVVEAVAEEIEVEVEVEAVAEAIAEEVVAEVIAEEIEAEVEEEEDAAPREKPAVPGAHLEVDIVPEGVDPLGRDTDPADPYASVAEAYERRRSRRWRERRVAGGRAGACRADLDGRDRSCLRGTLPGDREAQDGDRAGDAATGHAAHISSTGACWRSIFRA